MTLTVDTLTVWMNKFADKIETNKQYLSDLDTPIGDGDHGFNMDRGMKAVEEKLSTKPSEKKGKIFLKNKNNRKNY